MLAMADKHGRVWGSVPGLANRARVPVEVAREALESFMSPDADSRTEDHEGRRIRKIDGGWALLNYGKYRSIRDEEERRAYKAQKERERRARGKVPRGQTRGQNGQTWTPVDTNGHNAEAEALKTSTSTPPSPKSTQTTASGSADAQPPFPPDPLKNSEVRTLTDLIVCTSPEGTTRHLQISEVTPSERIAVLNAAKWEAEKLEMNLPDALRSLLAIVEGQVAALPPGELRFLGNVEKYFAKRNYRKDAASLTGGNNGSSKGKRMADATRAILTKLATGEHSEAGDGGGHAPPSQPVGRRNRTLLPKIM